MPEEYSSPEEKLLRLIRGEKKPKEKEKAVPHSEDTRAGSREGGAATVVQKRNIAAQAAQPKGGRDYIKFVNITLIAVLVVIAGVLLADAINFKLRRPAYVSEAVPKVPPHKVPPHEVPPQREREKAAEHPAPQPQSQPSSDTFSNSDALVSRDLFRPPALAPATGIPQVSYEKLKDLSLKGIIAGDKPQAIIEDEKNKKSYFLYKGESVNDIKVEDIQSDRVILRVNGEVLELTL